MDTRARPMPLRPRRSVTGHTAKCHRSASTSGGTRAAQGKKSDSCP